MNREVKEADQYEQEHDLHAAIGEFAVSFTLVCMAMEDCIIRAMEHAGLKEANLTRSLLVGYTARPLLESFKTVVTEMRKNDGDDMRILANVSKRMQNLIEERNDLMHGTWFIGWSLALTDEEDFSKAIGQRYKRTKDGLKMVAKVGTVEQFNKMSKEADHLTMIGLAMAGCLATGTPFTKVLRQSEDGTVKPLF